MTITKTVDFLMNLDCNLWDLLGIECGSDFLNKDLTYNSLFDSYCKAVKNELEKNGIKKISKKVYEILENENYHSMNRALTILGFAA